MDLCVDIWINYIGARMYMNYNDLTNVHVLYKCEYNVIYEI